MLKRKIICAATAVIMTLSSAIPAFAADFTDMTAEYAWAQDYVDEMADAGIIQGYEDNTFRPGQQVTRLEVLALFARAMGSQEEINAPIVEMALEEYESAIETCGLAWGQGDIAYLLYKGVLKESDLATYLVGARKSQAMPRHEAAVIITKAMYGESEAKANTSVSLDYTDQKDIPTDSLQYVAYVYEQGIMTGRDDGTFSPNDGVTRAEMAVMLSRTTKLTKYSYKSVKLLEVDTENETLTYLDGDTEVEKEYTDETSMNVLGEPTQPRYMPVNLTVIMSFSGNDVMTVDAMTDESDQEISGVLTANTSSSGKVTSVTIEPVDGSESVTYDCADDVSIIYDGSPATITSFKKNQDIVTLTIESGLVTRISGETKSVTIRNATIEDVTIEPFEMTISHANAEYDGQTYTISPDVTVTKNGNDADFQSIYKGDTATLTLEYGVITKVSATSTTRTQQGTIKSITIAQQSSIVVTINSVDQEYMIANDLEILINGEAGTLYDFRVGDQVVLTLESEAVTKISATSAQTTTGSIVGEITAVNTAYGFIRVEWTDNNGNTFNETVYINNNRTKILTQSGTEIDMKDLEDGNTVNCMGTTTNGAFTATVIVVTAE